MTVSACPQNREVFLNLVKTLVFCPSVHLGAVMLLAT